MSFPWPSYSYPFSKYRIFSLHQRRNLYPVQCLYCFVIEVFVMLNHSKDKLLDNHSVFYYSRCNERLDLIFRRYLCSESKILVKDCLFDFDSDLSDRKHVVLQLQSQIVKLENFSFHYHQLPVIPWTKNWIVVFFAVVVYGNRYWL